MAHLPVFGRRPRYIGTAGGAVDTSPRHTNGRSAGRVPIRELDVHDRLRGAHATGREIASSKGQELDVAELRSQHRDLRADSSERRLLPIRRSARNGVQDVQINADLCHRLVRENRLVSVEFTRLGHAVLRRRRRIRKSLRHGPRAGSACQP